MLEHFINFIISYSAGLVNPLVEKLSESGLEDKLNSSFKKAMWKWMTEDEDNRRNYEISDFRDLLPYIEDSASSKNPDISYLIDIWKQELYNDEICKAALDDFQHTQIQRDVRMIKDAIVNKDISISPLTFQKKKDIATIKELLKCNCSVSYPCG